MTNPLAASIVVCFLKTKGIQSIDIFYISKTWNAKYWIITYDFLKSFLKMSLAVVANCSEKTVLP